MNAGLVTHSRTAALRTGAHRVDIQLQWAATKSALKRAFLVCLLFGLVLSLLQLALPLFSMEIFDRVLPSSQIPTLVALMSIVIFLTLISTLLDSSRSSILANSSQEICKRLDRVALKATFDDPRSSRALLDLDTIRNFLSGPITIALLDLPWSFFYVLVLALINVWLGLYTLVAFAIVAGLSLAGNYYLADARSASRRIDIELAKSLRISEQEKADLAAMGVLPGLLTKLMALRIRKSRILGKQLRNQSWADALNRTARAILQIGILALAAILTIFHQTNAGAIVASSMLFTRSIAPVERLSGSIVSIRQAASAWRNLNAFVARASINVAKLTVQRVEGRITLQRVSVRIGGRLEPILSDVTLETTPGSLYVIVGCEGAGKSTLAKLLCGAMKASVGRVTLDGMSFDNYDSAELAEQIGYFSETLSSRTGTISDIISREGGMSDADVVVAATLAGIDDIVRALPCGYQTILAAGSEWLSAGQMKRLALARAIYGNPKLLVLDEPMIGLDDAGEDCVLAILTHFKEQGCTVIVVAKSPRLLRLADQVLLIDGGRLKMSWDAVELKSYVGPRGLV